MNWYKQEKYALFGWGEKKNYSNIVASLAKDMNRELIPKIHKLHNEVNFKGFDVKQVNNSENFIARYIRGTTNWPVIELNLHNAVWATKRYNTSFETIIKMDVVRELGLAIQEVLGLRQDYREADNFARMWMGDHGLPEFGVAA